MDMLFRAGAWATRLAAVSVPCCALLGASPADGNSGCCCTSFTGPSAVLTSPSARTNSCVQGTRHQGERGAERGGGGG
jgi:hypothetical protein